MAGTAACLHDDLRRAEDTFPGAPVVAVNGAARLVKAIMLVSQHPERMTAPGFEWSRHQLRKFGPGFTIHAPDEDDGENQHIDYRWTIRKGGGSAWFARKVSAMIGFGPVVLCGCPLDPGPYVGNHNIGGFMDREDIVADLRKGIEDDTDWHDGCISMSGWTKDILGC